MAVLPTELMIHEILTSLPVESLLRFKCVSKSYNALISSREFIDLHLRRSYSSDSDSDSDRLLILLTRNRKQLYLLDVDSPDPASTVVNIQLPNALDMLSDKCVSVLCSFNGLLCLGLQSEQLLPICKEIVLINPCTRVHWSIPRSNCSPRDKICCWESFGLGFDDINNDYKLVRVTLNDAGLDPFETSKHNREVTVYSVKENTWKLIEDVDDITDFHLHRGQNDVVLKNHLLHWVFASIDSGYRIWCFDARSNEWATKMPLTDLTVRNQKFVREINLGVLQGCLCLSARVNNSCYVIWMMKEYGLTESWVKFDISVATTYGFSRVMVPFGFRKESKHEVLIHERETGHEDKLFWCDTRPDLSNCRTEEIKGVSDFVKVFYFKGSLVAIPDGHRIKESTNQQDILLS